MYKLLLLTVLVVYVNCIPLTQNDIDAQWIAFKKQFRNSNEFNINSGEESLRREIFEKNYRKIVSHNTEADTGLHTYRLGVNQFTDWTHEEYKQRLNIRRAKRNQTLSSVHDFHESLATLPTHVDWRDKHVVTPIKDQKDCGGCWVFSTIASLEGQLALTSGKLTSLSEQNILDCDPKYGCASGGFVEHAFDTIIKEGGVETEARYPFRNDEAKRCTYKKSLSVLTMAKYSTIKPGSESSLQQAVASVGPIAIYIDADPESFMSYESGIYSWSECKTDYDDLLHSVTVVGYGSENGHDYWLVKNSWDTTWGESGYIRVARNKGNMCGVATFGGWPVGVKAL